MTKKAKKIKTSKPKPKTSKSPTKPETKRSKKRKKLHKKYSVIPTRYLIRDVYRLWRAHWRQIGLFILLYAAFYFIFVRALTAFDVSELRDIIDSVFGTNSGEIGSSLVLTGAVFGLSLELDQVSGLYAAILFMIFSLAFLWLLRHYKAGKLTTLKKAFYQGMSPLVPIIIIFVIMSLQLVPLSIGGLVLGNVFSNDIAIYLWEQALVWLFFILMLVLSGYWLTGSVMAFYISTIPDMTPMKALKVAKDVLKKRRMVVLQRILVFLIFTFSIGFALLLLVVMFAEAAALVAVTAMSVIALPWIHSFLYTLYRSLIDD